MSTGEDTGERNPFAPPPADAPDQPWRPRIPHDEQAPAQSPSEEDEESGQVPPPGPWSPGHRGGWSAPPLPPQPSFDPNDPVQRRSRYALSAGMAGMVCLLIALDLWPVGLLLGALAVYWSITALRAARPRASSPMVPGREGIQPRPQTPAALGGLITGAVTVLYTFVVLGLQLGLQPYASCVNDALTKEAAASCSSLVPSHLRTFTSSDDN